VSSWGCALCILGIAVCAWLIVQVVRDMLKDLW